MESFVEDLNSQVQCLFCHETMNEPKLLKCFHTFCKHCIKSNAQLDGNITIFKCPQCISQTVLEQLSDVEDLQTSMIHTRILQVLSFLENQKVCSVEVGHCEALWRCLDCDCSLCDECLGYHAKFAKSHKVLSLSNLTKEDIGTMTKREESCKTHISENVEWYCRDCDKLICVLCLKDHDHDEHKLSSLPKFLINAKEMLSKNLEEIKELTSNGEERMKQQENIAIDIRDYGEKAKENVKKVTKRLVKSLLDQEQQLLTHIQKTITKAERNLRIFHHTSAAQEFIEYFTHNGTASEMIEILNEECAKKFTYEPFQHDLGGIDFKPNERLYSQVKTGLGKVTFCKKADANQCSLKVESNIEAMKLTKLTVVMKTTEGQAANEYLDNVTILVTPEDDVQLGEKEMMVDGEATVNLTAHFPGQVTVHIEVRGNPVPNSPNVLNVKPQHIPIKVTKIAQDLSIGSKDFRGIAVNKSNTRIAVGDSSSHCIRVFNIGGDLLLKFGSEGSGQGQFKHPFGLEFIGETDLVVSDFNNHRICILDTVKGRIVKTFGCQGMGNGQLKYPRGMCVDDAFNIFLCDSENHRIQVFSKDGDFLYKFNLQNGKPFGIIAHKGLFYVSVSVPSMVHVIDMKNKQLSSIINTIGGKDCGVGQLKELRGLAIDSDGNLLVCNEKMISKFTLDGHYIGRTNSLSYNPYFIEALADGNVIYSSMGGGLFSI
ncbi:E3 ubiquitin-protein ligase TRIM71-like [Exaiptasia diaphana]|uniref:E3 ubiquitin-protein ligase TRIM71 n=1 Tax=Exaiptasia diaphana TaxID=2652724 RepID=A0A913WUB8_EXADI|nr:E3 ubiquitin-protein ligase TRIM71-like [Exaiptasia diaphana]